MHWRYTGAVTAIALGHPLRHEPHQTPYNQACFGITCQPDPLLMGFATHKGPLLVTLNGETSFFGSPRLRGVVGHVIYGLHTTVTSVKNDR
ncbi:MAG: hypothetical protein AAGF95_11570 [Chloroflexota bacterium]